MIENGNIPYMQSLASCLHKVVQEGYTEDFQLTGNGLRSIQHSKNYDRREVHVHNYFHFEGSIHHANEAVLYLIETDDGTRGTLTELIGNNEGSSVAEFLKNPSPIDKCQ